MLIFRSALIQGTILIVPTLAMSYRGTAQQHTNYRARQLNIIRLGSYYATMSSHGCSITIHSLYQSESESAC